MSDIAILTNNVFFDQKLSEQLQFLGHEVYCSQKLVGKILEASYSDIYSIFEMFIFSETLTNYQVQQLLERMPLNKIAVFREMVREPTKEEIAEWSERGLIKWFTHDTGMNELRELVSSEAQLSESFLVNSNTNSQDPLVNPVVKKISEIIELLSLTSNERIFFLTLWKAKGAFVKRTEMSEKIWKQEASNSTLAQLSQIAKRIRMKMEVAGFPKDCVLTNWSYGYALAPIFFENKEQKPCLDIRYQNFQSDSEEPSGKREIKG